MKIDHIKKNTQSVFNVVENGSTEIKLVIFMSENKTFEASFCSPPFFECKPYALITTFLSKPLSLSETHKRRTKAPFRRH